MLQIRNGLSFHLHNHGNLRRQKNSSPSVSIPTMRNSIYLQHFRETRNWYRHELTIDSNGSRRSTHKRKLHCMVLDTRMHPFHSKQELPSKKSKLDWDTPVQNYFGYPRSGHAIQEAGSSPEIGQLYWLLTQRLQVRLQVPISVYAYALQTLLHQALQVKNIFIPQNLPFDNWSGDWAQLHIPSEALS